MNAASRKGTTAKRSRRTRTTVKSTTVAHTAGTSANRGALRSDGPVPGQIVLVLQGGGALGAYQAGVYQAMHESRIEPDWVIGTSIGAINGALIAANPAEHRVARLHEFWDTLQSTPVRGVGWPGFNALGSNVFDAVLSSASTIFRGIPSFFEPNLAIWRGTRAALGAEAASYYSTAPLLDTLSRLADFEYLSAGPAANHIRLTVGAVNACTGEMHYFDSRDTKLGVEHVMASGALPPAFPAVRIDGEPYWDGGIYSNTPIEAVLEDNPRRDSVIFAVNVWPPAGAEPESLWQVMAREKDIRYASRANSHIAKQKQIHRLRHVIRELSAQIPERKRASPKVRELASWGCGTIMHVLRLQAPSLEGEDHWKDIDFTEGSTRARWQAGYDDTLRMIESAPWRLEADPIEGVIEHQLPGKRSDRPR